MKTKILAVTLLGAILVGCAVPVSIVPSSPPTTNTVGNITTVIPGTPAITNYGVNPILTTVASGAQIAAPLVPQPWGLIIGAIGTLLAAAGTGIAAAKNAQLNTNASMLASVITGVETAGTPATKTAIQNLATAAGVSSQLDAIVQAVTATVAPKGP